MIEQLAKWTTLFRPPCLCAIHCVKGLVEKQADRPREIDPWWTILIEAWIVIDQSDQVDNDKAEPAQGDL